MTREEIAHIKSCLMQYTGVSVVDVAPMTRGEYNELRGWSVPANENPNDEGFIVENRSFGSPNVPGFSGYVSWLPKDIFERVYRYSGTGQSRIFIEMEDLYERICSLDGVIRACICRDDMGFSLNVMRLNAMKSYYAALSAIWTHMYGWESNPSRYRPM